MKAKNKLRKKEIISGLHLLEASYAYTMTDISHCKLCWGAMDE